MVHLYISHGIIFPLVFTIFRVFLHSQQHFIVLLTQVCQNVTLSQIMLRSGILILCNHILANFVHKCKSHFSTLNHYFPLYTINNVFNPFYHKMLSSLCILTSPNAFQNYFPESLTPIWVPKTNALLAKANIACYGQTHKTQMLPACMLGLPGKYKCSHVSSQPAQEWI